VSEHLHQQVGNSIRITGWSEEGALVAKRMNEAVEQMRCSMAQGMYAGKPDVPRKRSWRDIIRANMDRVHDAWLVLTGQAYID